MILKKLFSKKKQKKEEELDLSTLNEIKIKVDQTNLKNTDRQKNLAVIHEKVEKGIQPKCNFVKFEKGSTKGLNVILDGLEVGVVKEEDILLVEDVNDNPQLKLFKVKTVRIPWEDGGSLYFCDLLWYISNEVIEEDDEYTFK